MERSSGILNGVQEICDYLGISKPTFHKFIEIGLPARFHEKRWYAHAENLEKFFMLWTGVSCKGMANVEEK